jgi:hypothetical protein
LWTAAEAAQIDYWMISGLFFYCRFRLNQTASGKASFSGGQPSQKRLQNNGESRDYYEFYTGFSESKCARAREPYDFASDGI